MAEVVNNLVEYENNANRILTQFAFILFIPNPMTKSIKYYVDGDPEVFFKPTDEFINVIKEICGYQEANKIKVACSEYGVPFLYDRDKKMLKQVMESEPERNIDVSLKRIEDEDKKEQEEHKGTLNAVFDAILKRK